MADGSDDHTARLLVDCGLMMGENQRTLVRALHESTIIADRIREAIADSPPKLVMLALSDLLQEHLNALGHGRAGQRCNTALQSALVNMR
jgi:hypothetical protein